MEASTNHSQSMRGFAGLVRRGFNTTLSHSIEAMEPTLQLNFEDRSAVQEVILQNLKSEDWQQIEAAIFVANGTYVYKRKVSDHPLAFEYKCLSPEALQRAFHIERIDTGWLPTNIVRCGSNTAGEWAVLFAPLLNRRWNCRKLERCGFHCQEW